MRTRIAVLFFCSRAGWLRERRSGVRPGWNGKRYTKDSGQVTDPDEENDAAQREHVDIASVSGTAQSPTRATGRTHTVNLNGGVSLEMVEIPAGSFCMGSNNDDDDQKPVHRVTIKYSYYMGKYEVTQAQWRAVMGTTLQQQSDKASQPYMKGEGENYPMYFVSWNDAEQFIEKLNQMNDGYTYRMPTEAEWEYAWRAGTTGDYAGNLDDVTWYEDNSGLHTHPVGQKQPNAFGLFDMHGNVWEWCQDWYHETYYGAPTDGSAWLSGGEQKYRVQRGSSWNTPAAVARSPARGDEPPDDRSSRNNQVGFRVVAVR